jgi:hypothetical protein
MLLMVDEVAEKLEVCRIGRRAVNELDNEWYTLLLAVLIGPGVDDTSEDMKCFIRFEKPGRRTVLYEGVATKR